jgi:hypothetical protein
VDNQRVSYFGIRGYQPRWLNGRRAVTVAHGRRLHALIGRRLTHSWLAWERNDDQWFADCPVLLDFDGMQVEINHQKFDDLSITSEHHRSRRTDPLVQRPGRVPTDLAR